MASSVPTATLLSPGLTFMFGSALVHGVAAAMLVVRVQPLPEPTKAKTSDSMILIDVSEVQPMPVPPTDAAQPSVRPTPKQPKRRFRSKQRRASASVSTSTAATLSESTTITPPGDGAPVLPALPKAMKSSSIAPAMDPVRVARASSVGPLRSRVDGAQERLDAYLYERANRNTTVSRRDSPRLTPTNKGGLKYDGPRFDAEILPDGTVRFSDTAGVTLYGNPKDFKDWLKTPPPDLEEPRLAQAPKVNGNGNRPASDSLKVTFSADINDMIARARGEDPYYAERAWFMRETREERDRLATKFKRRTSRYAAQSVVKRARVVWKKRRSFAQGRKALFELWDDCAEGEIGGAARTLLLGYISEVTQSARYSTSELASLNASRKSRARFSPYRVAR